MRTSQLIFLFFLNFSLFTFCQIEVNDNKNLELLKKYKGTNNDSLLFYGKKLQTSPNICLKYVGKIHEALAVYNMGNYKLSETLANKIINELNQTDELCLIKIKIESLNRLFWIKKNQQSYNDAFQYLLEIKKEINNFPKRSAYYKNIEITTKVNSALIQSLLGNDIEARKTLIENLKNLRSIKDNSLKEYSDILNRANILNLIGESFLKSSNSNKSNLDSAAVYFEKAFEVTKNFNPPHKNSETIYNLRKAEVLIAQKYYEQALDLINKFSLHSFEYNTSDNINSLKAICFYNLKKNDSTLIYSYKFLNKINDKKNKKRLIAIYDVLSNQYFKNKKLDSAYKYSQLTVNEINTLNENKNEVNKAYYLYDFKNAQTLNNSIINKENKNRLNFSLIVVLLLVISFFIILYQYKKNENIKSNFKEAQLEFKEKPLPPKKEYNIDEELETSLLQGINELKDSTDFLDANFNINVFAKKLNTNTSYLSYIINKESGKTYKQYITELRIEYLIEKLKTDSKFKNYSIKSLAEEIGYTNASAFTRAFKKYKDITPSEYIKSLEKR